MEEPETFAGKGSQGGRRRVGRATENVHRVEESAKRGIGDNRRWGFWGGWATYFKIIRGSGVGQIGSERT